MSGAALAAAGLRGHVRRLVATALAIVIGVAFVAVSMLLLDSVGRGVEAAAADGVDRHDVVLTPGEGVVPGDAVEALRRNAAVEQLVATAEVWGTVDGRWVPATTLPPGNGTELLSGRLPRSAGEAAVSAPGTEIAGTSVGDEVVLRLDQGATEAVALEIVGVVHLGSNPRYAGWEALVVSEDALRSWVPDLTYDEVRVDVTAAAASDPMAPLVGDLPPGATMRTGSEEAAHRARAMTGDTDVLGALLLGFAAVALATTAIVIANTFAIVLAQRSRELALLRCVGATRGQVRRTVLLEALGLGAVASALGVGLAVALAALAAGLVAEVDLGMPVTVGLHVGMAAVVVPWTVGVLVTVLASWWPTRRATMLPPVSALQPAVVAPAGSGAGLVRIGAAVLLSLLGVAALVAGAGLRSVLLGVAGGLLSFGGVLLGAVILVPAAVRAAGVLSRGAGVPGRLAVDHAVANPARAAATSAALLVGTTLITMTSVGAASGALTAQEEIDAQFPADVVVLALPDWSDAGDGLPRGTELAPAVADRVLSVDGVAAHAALTGTVLEIDVAGGGTTREDVLAVDPAEARQVLRDPALAETLRPGTLGASQQRLTALGWQAGQQVTVRGPNGATTAELVEFGLDWTLVAHPDVVAAVDAAAPRAGLLLRLDEGADASAALTAVREAAVGQELVVDGAAALREAMNSILRVMVLVATALLGVAVVIAVIGIANTLSLSVLERTREHALLRALGLSRVQLRASLALEGVLLALVSALLGVLLGTGYAWFGVQALLPSDMTARLDLPWGPLAAVLGCGVLAGLLASVLPARRAVRTPPAAGLAMP